MHTAIQATTGAISRPIPPSLAALPPVLPVPAAMPVPSIDSSRAQNGTESGTHSASPQVLADFQEQLLLEHLSLVRFVARSIAEKLPPHVELEELVSAGMLGLLDATRKFKPGRNVQFRSYAQFRIRGAILDSLRSLDWSPRELRRKARALHQARHTLEARFGRPASETELAAELHIPLLELQQLSGSLRGLEITTLSVERGEDSDEQELAFVPAKESENPLLQLLEGESRERVLAAIEALPERERLIMRLYYFEEMTMREIGQVLGVVESRISQIHHDTLRRLRIALAPLRRTSVRPVAARKVA